MQDVIQYWYEGLTDKISKDKKESWRAEKEKGELYFDLSDIKGDYILTFKQFVHFLTKGSTESMTGKVHFLFLIININNEYQSNYLKCICKVNYSFPEFLT